MLLLELTGGQVGDLTDDVMMLFRRIANALDDLTLEPPDWSADPIRAVGTTALPSEPEAPVVEPPFETVGAPALSAAPAAEPAPTSHVDEGAPAYLPYPPAPGADLGAASINAHQPIGSSAETPSYTPYPFETEPYEITPYDPFGQPPAGSAGSNKP